ncbi:MAG TPA: NADAR family protein [Paralcaligenes sp.]
MTIECHGLDTPELVCFYEQDFYVLSNFSAFRIQWRGRDFDTSEAAYHWERFATGHDNGRSPAHGALAASIADKIRFAPSAHEAFKLAQANKQHQRPDWDDAKVGVMLNILRAKADQHEYVKRKLLATGNRHLVENSWRDDFWGWGPNKDGQNMLGKLWMTIRRDLRQQQAA